MKKLKFLLDANLSPETAFFLRLFNFDVKSLIEEDLGGIKDEEVLKIAQKEKRIIITFDLDFGELYYFSSKRKTNILVLRLDDQRIEAVHSILGRFLKNQVKILKRRGSYLVILSETRVRIS
ncbi:MAG: DUF5615 family PIN-like protein [Candidatus Brennerbacteria bacterium]|nr:DUF5615 family PIN-like protein [Candidatus Brennerbacteria bacterium]